VLEKMCIPAASGGDWNALAKANGFKKSGEAWVLKGPTAQFKVNPPGSNPNSCIVDIVHPVDPAAPVIVALHNWATYGHGYTLYQNGKNVAGGAEFTIRSWENTEDGKAYALVFTTTRKADGSPSKGTQDTSQMIFSVKPAP
jgi:hypothetical protein